MGRRSEQGNLFAADTQHLEFVGRDTFYGFLAEHGRELFRDEDFAALYCHDNGRTSVPPSLLAMALLLQAHDRVSDAEAVDRARFDVRWKVALGLEIEEALCAKSTLQEFRAQLVIHEAARAMLHRSLSYALERGYLRRRSLRVALDTTPILGRGAVLDTCNLIGEGIVRLCRTLAEVLELAAEEFAQAHGYGRYFGTSLKGESEVDWDDAGSRNAFLTEIIGDGERLLGLAGQVASGFEAGSEEEGRIVDAAALLTRLLWQDVERSESGGWKIKKGTAKDRVPSASDPEQRHGRKSHGKTFTGHKASVAVDVESQLVTSVDVIAGNASDGDHAAWLVEESEASTGCPVEQVLGDTAYGGMAVRDSLGDREVVAPTVKPRGNRFPKEAFGIDEEEGRVVCPAGQETRSFGWRTVEYGGERRRVKEFAFGASVCGSCPLREACFGKTKQPRGRHIQLHPEESRLREARALERTREWRARYRCRVVVEHRIARLVQLGTRQSRFVGRSKTAFQLLMAATVANLTLVAGWAREQGADMWRNRLPQWLSVAPGRVIRAIGGAGGWRRGQMGDFLGRRGVALNARIAAA